MGHRIGQGHVSPVAARWMIFGEWRAHPGRIIVAGLAIAIGVALGFAVHLINASALNEFARAERTIDGDADLTVQAVSELGFDPSLYPKLARLQGVADASPAVQIKALIDAAHEGEAALTLIGLDALRAVHVTPSLVPRTGSADVLFDADALFLSQAALTVAGKHVGDTIAVTAQGRTVRFRIAGTLPAAAEDEPIAVTDIAGAQWRFGLSDRLERIDLKLEDGADPARVRAELSAVLPAGAQIGDVSSATRRADSLSRAYRVNLDMLALMALLSGAFLVYSGQSLSVARRRAQFALLRVLGMTRRALILQVLAEGAAVGGAGSALGLALGLGLAAGTLTLLGGDLGGGYFEGTRPELIFPPLAAGGFFLLGLAAALVGGLLPAREAASAMPAIALKDAGGAAEAGIAGVGRLTPALLALGGAVAFLPPVDGLPLFGYAAIALILAGGVTAMPWLARLLLGPLERHRFANAAFDLAVRRLWGAPSHTAIALSGIVASTSLMIAMAVMVTSFRASVDEWLIQILPSDVYLRVEDGEAGALDVKTQMRMAEAPGIARIDFRKAAPLRLTPDRPAIALIARTIEHEAPERSLPLIGQPLTPPKGTIAVWVSEPATWIYGFHKGDDIVLPISASGGSGKGVSVFVAGIWRDYGRQQGAIAIDSRDYTRLTGDTSRTDAAIDLKAGTLAPAAIAGLRALLPKALAAHVVFARPSEIRALSLRIFDRSFAVTYLLEAIAMLVGLAGVAATFSAQTLARRKEFGMLRHLGVRKRQVAAMLMAEGALLGAVGVLAGIGLGVAISQVLIHVINPQSFHWTMATRLPWTLFLWVAFALILTSALAAVLAGRRALSLEAVLAVKEDW